MSKLTPKEERFCQEYIKTLNASAAAKAAGYGKTEGSIRAQAARLLTRDEVAERIQLLMDERAKRNAIDADTVLQELLRIARVDVLDLFDAEGNLLPISQIPENARRAISSLEVFEEFEQEGRTKVHIGDTKKIKLWDKNKALELLGKHLKLFTDMKEIKNPLTDLNDAQIDSRIQALMKKKADE